MFDSLAEDTNDHLPQSSDLAQSHNNVIHNDLTPTNRNRAATTGVIVNTPSANTNINTANVTTTTKDNDSPQLFNNFSNSKPLNHAQSPKVKSPPAVPEKPSPASPAKPKRTSGSHTSGPESPRVPVQSPRVSSQSPKPAGTHGVKFGAVETIPTEDDNYPVELPTIPKKPPIPVRNSLSPPLPNASPATKNVPPVTSSSDQGYYLFSPDDDESSSEGDYDEEEAAIGAGKWTINTHPIIILWLNFRWLSS